MLTMETVAGPLIGGALIGIASAIMLLFNGRIAGISGIYDGLLKKPQAGDLDWRVAFLVGLVAGGVILQLAWPTAFPEQHTMPLPAVAAAGLLVGFGTRLGSGCTSGHGVCGVSRMSPRSITATITFMIFGMVAVGLVRLATGGLL